MVQDYDESPPRTGKNYRFYLRFTAFTKARPPFPLATGVNAPVAFNFF